MATKPKAILSTHDGREASPITKASNVLFENGQTAQDILNDRQDAMISPVIENSSSMFKVGQGDNVDYSANVVNGAYESMVLKGNTKVNLIQESSSQDVVLPYEFEDGQYATINDTKETGALGVELKGQTLVNLCPNRVIDYTATSDWDGFNALGQNSATQESWRTLQDLKPNTKYFISCYVETFNVGEGQYYLLNNPNNSTVFAESLEVRATGLHKWVLTSKSELTEGVSIVLRCQNAYARGAIKIRDIMIIEYQEGMENWDIPYFTGMTSVKLPILHTVGKNLFDTNNSTDGYGFSEGVILDKSDWFLSNYVRVEPNATYVMSCDGESGKRVQFYDRDKKLVTHNRFENNVILVPNNRNIVYMRTNAPLTLKSSLQIEKGGSKTTYENHKSSILSLPEEVVLKDINGIKDTLNCSTGEYVKRIEERVFDGSETWTQNGQHADGSYRHICNTYTDAKVSSDNVLCDKMSFVKVNSSTGEGMTSDIYITYTTTTGKVQIVTTKTLAELKTWLSQNPITVQYELATPIVTKINLSSTLKSWNATTHIYSEIPENSLYPILSHVNPSYPVILKPSTKYSIVANSYSNNHTNSAINFNLGGATASTVVGNRVSTVTTPSTLTSEKLVMSGRGNMLNNVMVIEGDVVGDEPYFEGMCDSKSPILSNIGKNLFDGEMESGTIGYTGNLSEDTSRARSQNYITIDSSQTYRFINYEDYVFRAYYEYDSNKKFIRQVSSVGQSLALSFSSNTKYIKFVIAKPNTSFTIDSFAQKIAIYLGNDTTTTYEPYKSNILSCNGDKIELTEDMFEQGSFTGVLGSSYESLKEVNSNRVRTKKLLKLNRDTSYVAKCNEGYLLEIAFYDEEGLYTGTYISWTSSKVFNIDKNCYVAIKFRKSSDSSVTVNDFDKANLQIREVDKTIVLRSLPNGVCDTLNVETGEYVQRIGEKVFDGSEDENWELNNTESTSTKRFIIDNFLTGSNITNDWNGANKYVCDKIHKYLWSDTVEFGITVINNSVFLYNNNIDYSIGALKTWLSQNPVTIQYELATPIIKTVDLSGYPFSYENGHVVLSSGSIEQSLTPKVEYSVATNRNGQIRSNQKMVEKHQKELDKLQAIVLANLVNSQYNQTLTTLKYELSRV